MAPTTRLSKQPRTRSTRNKGGLAPSTKLKPAKKKSKTRKLSAKDSQLIKEAASIFKYGKQAVCIGSPDNTVVDNMLDSVIAFLRKHPLRQNNENLYISRVMEGDFSVFVLICAELPPIEYLARHSMQRAITKFEPFEEKYKWVEVSPRMFILKAIAPLNFDAATNPGKLSDEFLCLPIKRPSSIENVRAKAVEQVLIKYKGQILLLTDKEEISDYVKDEDNDLTTEDIPALETLFTETKAMETEANESIVAEEQTMHRNMVSSLAATFDLPSTVVVEKLERMSLYKVYPTNTPPPIQTWMGLQDVYIKNTTLNSVAMNADGYF